MNSHKALTHKFYYKHIHRESRNTYIYMHAYVYSNLTKITKNILNQIWFLIRIQYK